MSTTNAKAAVNTTTNPWLGTNLWVQIMLVGTSVFGGMTQTTAGMVVAAVSGVIAAGFALRTWVLSAKFNKNVLKDVNFWAYLTNVVVALSPQLADLLPSLKTLVDALYAQNWGQVITAGVSLLSILFYSVIKKKT